MTGPKSKPRFSLLQDSEIVFEASPQDEQEKQNEPSLNIQLINANQFKIVSKLFDDYYDIHEPHTKFDAIKDLRRKLNRKQVLNVNVIDNEQNKIKKENMGKGALLDNPMRVDDSSMCQFNKELVKLLLHPNKEDKFMQMKIQNAQKHEKLIEKRRMIDRRKNPESEADLANE